MILTLCKQKCHLLAERGVFWEENKSLIIADIHIGKGTVFRKAGIPIPEGIMDNDLKRISTLIRTYDAKQCIIIGDLIHAKSGLSPSVVEKFADWISTLPCEVHLILGNHDRSLHNNLPHEWNLHIYENGLAIPPFYFSHFPLEHPDLFVFAGHLHPKIEIRDKSDRLVLKCFQIFPHLAIIPAFSSFAGGTFVTKNPQCKIYAIADQSVIEI